LLIFEGRGEGEAVDYPVLGGLAARISLLAAKLNRCALTIRVFAQRTALLAGAHASASGEDSLLRRQFMGRDRLLRVGVASLGMLALSAMVHPVWAQNPGQILDSLRRRFQLPLVPATEVAATASRFAPGHNTSSQSAYGANFGDGFIGAGFASRTRSGSSSDGSAVAGFCQWN